MVCPYAKDIGYKYIRGCTVKPNRMGTPGGGTTHYMSCTEAGYKGDYEKCPFYRKSEETEK